MAGQYTEAQKRAILKYQKKFKHVALALTDEEHQKFSELAAKEGLSLTKLINRLLEQEYAKQFSDMEEKLVEIQHSENNKIILTDEQIEAVAYARQLYMEFASYLDFLWDWNWKSEGILNSLDSKERLGAINRKLTSAGFSRIKGIVIDQESLPENSNNLSMSEKKQLHDAYLDVMLGVKKSIVMYLRGVDELCGTNFADAI